MKVYTNFCLAIGFLFLLVVSFSGYSQKMKYHRITTEIEPELLEQLFVQGLEIDHFSYEQDHIFIAEVSDTDIDIFNKNKVKFTYLIKDIEKNIIKLNKEADKINKDKNIGVNSVATPGNFILGSYAGFYTYSEMQVILDQMRALYPNLISAKSSIGLSVEGRPLFMVKISDNPDIDEAEPEMLMTGVHHAREPVSMSQLIFFMWHILENYNTDNDIKTLINSTELYFVPIVNPDGYVYNQTTNPAGGGMWRKNRKNNGNGTYGVDPNRNYGYKWGYDNTGSSPTSSSDTYRGLSAFSEPETQILRNFANQHSFTVSMDFHSYGNYLIYPYSHLATNTVPELALFQQLSNHLTTENGFITGNANQTLAYLVNGGSNDWHYGEQTTKGKTYSFLPEVGTSSDGFWPAQSRIIPLCNSTIEMNKKAFKMATFFGKLTPLTNNATGNSGVINYSFQNFSINPATYTVTLASTNTEILSISTPKTYSNLTVLQSQNDNISFTIDPNTAIGTVLQFTLTVDNGLSPQTENISVVYNCALPPSGLNTTAITTTSAQLNWNAVSGISSYTVEYKLSTATNWSVLATAAIGNSIALNSLTQNTLYNYRVKSNCTVGASEYANAQFSTLSPVTYCTSKANNASLIWIDLVKLGSINRISGTDGGYFNGTTLSTNADRGSSQTLTFSSGFSSTTYRQYWRLWIDFNRNGVFTDAGEQVVSTNITGGGNGVVTFSIPTTALLGATRMRIASKNGAYPTSCETFAYGEVEDYSINITAPAAKINAEITENVENNWEKMAVISPNPVKEFININLNAKFPETINYSIISQTGSVLQNKSVKYNGGQLVISARNLMPGMYFVQLGIQNNKPQMLKFLKE